MLEAYAVTLLGVALAQASPGPNLLAVAGAALGQGRRAAIFTVFGIATGMLVWAAAVAFGLAAVLAFYPALLSVMKLLGGGYLCYLAIRALLAAWAGGAPSVQADQATRSSFSAWRRGLLVILTNPKAALMWTAVATFLFGSGLSAAEVLGFGPVAFVSGFVIYGTYGLLFSTGLASRAYARFARMIEAGFGIAFGVLGGKLVADGVREFSR